MLFEEANLTEVPGIVSCQRHGNRREAFVCRHLLLGTGLGFFQSDDDPDNSYPDAWCCNCEKVRQANDGEWPEESQTLTPIALVCGECYEEIKTKNDLRPTGSSSVQ